MEEVTFALRTTKHAMRADGVSVKLPLAADAPTEGADPQVAGRVQTGLPFEPLWQTPGGNWRYWCPKLDRNGRCTIYETRPALCVAYQPKQDRLCAEYETPMDQLGAELLKARTG